MVQVFSFKKNKTFKKNTGKWKKILEKSGNFVNPEKWEPCSLYLVVFMLLSFVRFTV